MYTFQIAKKFFTAAFPSTAHYLQAINRIIIVFI